MTELLLAGGLGVVVAGLIGLLLRRLARRWRPADVPDGNPESL